MHSRCSQGAHKVHAKCIQGTLKVNTRWTKPIQGGPLAQSSKKKKFATVGETNLPEKWPNSTKNRICVKKRPQTSEGGFFEKLLSRCDPGFGQDLKMLF